MKVRGDQAEDRAHGRGTRAPNPGPDGHHRRHPIGPAIAFVLVPLVTFLLVTAATTLLRHHAPLTYYQTVAFLIPSLLVTLALQGQFFRMQSVIAPSSTLADRHPRLAAVWVIAQRAAEVALLAYLAAGEIAALLVLAVSSSSALLFGLTAGAVMTAFAALGIVALTGTPWAR